MNEKNLLMILIILIIITGIIFFVDGHIIPSETFFGKDVIFQPTKTTDWDIYGNKAEVKLTDKGFHFTSLNNETDTINIFRNNSTHSFDGTTDLVFEFDYRTANQCGMYLVNNSGGRITVSQSSAINKWVHEKWFYDSTNQKITAYIDGVEQSSVDLSSQNVSTLGFQVVDWQGDADLYIEDWKAYSG